MHCSFWITALNERVFRFIYMCSNGMNFLYFYCFVWGVQAIALYGVFRQSSGRMLTSLGIAFVLHLELQWCIIWEAELLCCMENWKSFIHRLTSFVLSKIIVKGILSVTKIMALCKVQWLLGRWVALLLTTVHSVVCPFQPNIWIDAHKFFSWSQNSCSVIKHFAKWHVYVDVIIISKWTKTKLLKFFSSLKLESQMSFLSWLLK